MHPVPLLRSRTSSPLIPIELQLAMARRNALLAEWWTCPPVCLTSLLVPMLHPLVIQLVRQVARKGTVLRTVKGLTDLTRLLLTPDELLIGIVLKFSALLCWMEQQPALAQLHPSLD